MQHLNTNKILKKSHRTLVRCTLVLIILFKTVSYCFGQPLLPNAIGQVIPPKHQAINIINYDSAYVMYDNIKYSIDTLNPVEDSGVFHVYYIGKDYESDRYSVIGVESLQFPYKSYLILTDKDSMCPNGESIYIDSCYHMHIRMLYTLKSPTNVPVEQQKTNEAEVELIDDMNDRYCIIRGGRKDYIRCLSLHKKISISNNVCGLNYIISH